MRECSHGMAGPPTRSRRTRSPKASFLLPESRGPKSTGLETPVAFCSGDEVVIMHELCIRAAFRLCLLILVVWLSQGTEAQGNYYRNVAGYWPRSGIYSRRDGLIIGASSSSEVRRNNDFNSGSRNNNGNSGNADEIGSSNSGNGRVKLTVYYETNCPDSMAFITNQLWPTYQKLSSIMDVDLVPYGKAREVQMSNGTWMFFCQHGPPECQGNMIQTCAIKLYPRVEDHLSFVYCMESYATPSSAGAKCARRHNFDFNKIERCANGEDGNGFQHEMAQRTQSLTPPLNFVPWINVNGVHSRSVQDRALGNLQRVICNAYKGDRLTNCS